MCWGLGCHTGSDQSGLAVRLIDKSFLHKIYPESQYCVVTKFCCNKIIEVKFLSTIYDFLSVYTLRYFQPIYRIFGKLIVIMTKKVITANHETSWKRRLGDMFVLTWSLVRLLLSWHKRWSQIIMKLHEREFRGLCVNIQHLT